MPTAGELATLAGFQIITVSSHPSGRGDDDDDRCICCIATVDADTGECTCVVCNTVILVDSVDDPDEVWAAWRYHGTPEYAGCITPQLYYLFAVMHATCKTLGVQVDVCEFLRHPTTHAMADVLGQQLMQHQVSNPCTNAKDTITWIITEIAKQQST
jgi:hypothetical protein